MKMQDFFKSADGADIYDDPVSFQIISLRAEKTPDRGYGSKFNVQLKQLTTGEVVGWERDESDIMRSFTNTNKAGNVTWQGKDGDLVKITKLQLSGGRSFYKVEPNAAAGIDTPVGNLATPVAPTRPVSEPQQAIVQAKPAVGTDWGGTPRQTHFRAGLGSIVNSMIIAAGKEFLFSEAVLDQASEIFLQVREKADELEAMYKNH